jgi:hypothetical protein
VTQRKIEQSIFPDLPRTAPAVDKDGNFAPLWSLGFASLFQALQKNFKNEGILFPALSATDIATIQSIYNPALIGSPLPQNIPDISGQTVFDTTNRVPKQFIILYDNSTPPNIIQALWLNINVMLTNAGNPNGSVVGNAGWLCYNTLGASGSILYICTANGSTSWTAV